MSVEFDWQIIEGDEDETEVVSPPPLKRPRRRLPRWLIGVALMPVAALAIFAGYVTWTYRAQLSRVSAEVSVVAKSEAQALAANDRESFMALQDPDDSSWRTMQERRFGRTGRFGLPEYGLLAMSVAPQLGSVSLEPGGARLDATYQFTVTQPMPSGPVTVTLRVPQFYKPTPSGWVHARPDAGFWGPQRSLSGKHVMVLYSQRDADIIEPLVPHIDAVLDRACSTLNCPSQVTLTFANSLDSLGGFRGFPYGRSDGTFTLQMLSPYLTGLPADEASRNELYRAVESRIVRGLVATEWAGGQRFSFNSVAFQQLVRWHLSQAGLAGPFITPEITTELVMAMRNGMWQPLSAISLLARASGTSLTASDAMIPMAFEFISGRLGKDSLGKLAPAMATSSQLGDAIRTAFHINPATLEADWQKYLYAQAGPSLMVKSTQDPTIGSNPVWSLDGKEANQRS